MKKICVLKEGPSMTPREKFIQALRREPIEGHVPHFELVMFLTMEAIGRIHPCHRNYEQWYQMSAAERGVEFLWERSTKKLEEAQKQGQEQDGSQQQPHAPVQVAGKPRKKEEASQQAEKKPRTRKPSITPKM